jgi:hypothetical protein
VIVHAGLVRPPRGRAWRGVLIEGPVRLGKSDSPCGLTRPDGGWVPTTRVMLWMSGEPAVRTRAGALHGLLSAGVSCF